VPRWLDTGGSNETPIRPRHDPCVFWRQGPFFTCGPRADPTLDGLIVAPTARRAGACHVQPMIAGGRTQDVAGWSHTGHSLDNLSHTRATSTESEVYRWLQHRWFNSQAPEHASPPGRSQRKSHYRLDSRRRHDGDGEPDQTIALPVWQTMREQRASSDIRMGDAGARAEIQLRMFRGNLTPIAGREMLWGKYGTPRMS